MTTTKGTPLERFVEGRWIGTRAALAAKLGLSRMAFWKLVHGRHAATPFDVLVGLVAAVAPTANASDRAQLLATAVTAWKRTRAAADRRSA